jgi:hypothetical protein
MKKKIYLLAGTLFVLSLCSCSIQTFTDGNHQESSSDIVNIGLHFFLKDVRPMLPPVMNRSIVDA